MYYLIDCLSRVQFLFSCRRAIVDTGKYQYWHAYLWQDFTTTHSSQYDLHHGQKLDFIWSFRMVEWSVIMK